MEPENSSKKRIRGDSECGSSDPKRFRNDLLSFSSELEGVGLGELEGFELNEVNRIPDDILGLLDDSDMSTDRDPTIQDLDSVIRSFEEEILQTLPPTMTATADAFDMPMDNGMSRPDLGYLLGASDDELGLPPADSPSDVPHMEESADLTAFPPGAIHGLGSENELPGFDSFEMGFCEVDQDNAGEGENGEFVTLGGLFDYTEPSEFYDFSWRPESLPAV